MIDTSPEAIEALIWHPLNSDGGIVADAFGVMGFYRIIGRPGDWTVVCPKGAAMLHEDSFETQASARRWAEADNASRIDAAARELVPALAAERDALRAEVERLRAALQAAVDAWEAHNESGDMMQGRWVIDARSALKGGANG